jgi:alginate O-acetyltransferase complex protein AlgI
MLFNSIPFLIFFTIYISSIFFFRNQWKLITIIFSIFFYAYWSFYFCFLLILEAVFTWLIGNLIKKKNNHKKKYLVLGLVVPLIILFIFKYFNFFVSDILRVELQNTIFINIILPIGISFYTFQAIMYLVDVYKDKLQNVNLIDFLVFFLFFPNLIAGPLVRPKSFIPQINVGIKFTYKNFTTGSLLILWGYFLKLCVSNNLNIYVANVFHNILELSSSTLLIGSFFYSFLIYSDFAGYSLIAIGIAKLIGLNVPANFNNPFLSENITEFWRRWHISLSKFLRDYLYIPLGGNKYGLFTTCRNIIIVMLLGGLWHGASFNFIIWGGLHGIALSLEKINKKYFNININYTPVKKILTFFLVVIFFIPFGLPSFDSLILFWQQIKIFELLNISQIVEKFYVFRNLILIAILLSVETFINKKYFLQIKKNSLLYGFSLTVLLSLIICFGNFNETTFIYFQF